MVVNQKAKKEEQSTTGKATHEHDSRRGMRIAQQVWARVDNGKVIDSVVDTFDTECAKKCSQAARASQKQEERGLATIEEELPKVNAYVSCKAKDIKELLKDIRFREVKGRRVLNNQQYRVVSRIAHRVIAEMTAVAKEKHDSLGEPLRWCVHGGPGTGKSLIEILRDELFGNLPQ